MIRSSEGLASNANVKSAATRGPGLFVARVYAPGGVFSGFQYLTVPLSVLPEAAHRAAQATADMVIKAARSTSGTRLNGTTVPHIPAAVTASGYCQM
jgi:hypothetical protein